MYCVVYSPSNHQTIGFNGPPLFHISPLIKGFTVQRKLGIGMGGKEDKMGTTEHPINRPKNPQGKKGPFYGKNLVRTTELKCQNIVLPWNTPGCQGDRTTLGPENYLGSHATQDTKHRSGLMPERSDNRSVGAQQDNTLTRQLG